MSRTIENRIVSMGFDNSNFEKNVGQTLGSLDKLRESLNFDGSSRSMENLERSARGVNLSSLSESIVTVTDNFSMLETIAFSVLNNITNKAVDAGLRLAKSLTVDQISSGFGKYESQVNSVQTILNAVEGSTLDEVTEKIDKLQWFADETSYSLSDMLSNVSKFTANEIGLDDAVSAMTGIANWAAVSGQNAEAASRAMYNLSQAIGVGALKLQDWKSIQNANMGTAEFKKTAMEIAANLDDEHKTLEYIGDGIYQTLNGQEVTVETFDQTLSDAWLSKDVLMATLEKYSEYSDALYEKVQEFDEQGISITVADAAKYLEEEGKTFGELGKKAFKAAQQAKTFNEAIDATKDAISSSFSRIFNNIFGNYEEAVKMWSGFTEILYDTFVAPFDKISSIIAQWHKLSYDSLFGFDEDTETYGAFFRFFYNLSDLLEPLRGAWETIFPSKTTSEMAKGLKAVTDRFIEFVDKMKWSEDTASKIQGAFTRLFSFVKDLKDGIVQLWNVTSPIRSGIKAIISGIFELLSGIVKFFRDAIQSGKGINIIFIKIWQSSLQIQSTIDKVFDSVEKLFDSFRQNGGTAENFTRIINGLRAAIQILLNLISSLARGVMEIVGSLFGNATEGVGAFAGTIFESAATIGDYIVNLRNAIQANNTFGKAVGKIVSVIKNAFNFVSTAFQKITGMTFGEFFEHVLDVVKELFSYIGTFFDSINSGIIDDSAESVDKTGEKIGFLDSIFQGFGELLKTVFQMLKDLAPVIKEVFSVSAGILSSMGKSIATLFKGIDTKQLTTIVKTGILVAIGIALVKFIGSLKKIANIGGSLGDSIKEMFTSITGTLNAFQQKMKAESILIISEAIGILVASLLVLSSIDSEKLSTAIVALAAMFALVIASLKILSKLAEESKKYIPSMTKLASAMIMVSVSVGILSLSIKTLSGIKIGNLAAATIAIMAICEMMVLMVKQLSTKTKNAKKGIKNIAGLALAVNLLVVPILLLSRIKASSLAKAILGIGATLLTLSMITRITPKPKKLMQVAESLAIFGIAVLTMMPSILILSNIESNKVFTAILAILTLAMSMGALSKIQVNLTNIVALMTSMIAIGTAASLFGVALSIVAKFDWKKILAATLVMSTVMAAMVLLSKITNNVGAKAMWTLVGILSAFAAIIALIGIVMASTAKTVSLVIGIITSLMTVFSTIATEYDFSNMLEGVNNFSKIIRKLGSGLGVASVGFYAFGVAAIILGTGLTLVSKSAKNLATALKIMVSVIEKLVDMKDTVLSFAKILASAVVVFFMNVIISIPKMINKLITAISSVLPTILDSIYNIVKNILEYLTKIVGLVIEYGKQLIPPIAELLVYLITELLAILDNYISPIIEHLINILVKIIDGIASKLDVIIESIVNLIIKTLDALSKAIDTYAPTIIESINKLLKSIISLVLQAFGVDQETADNLAGKLLDGINAMFGFITEWVTKFIAWLLGEASKLFDWLDGILEDFFDGGWVETWNKVKTFFIDLWETMSNVVGNVKDKIVGFFKAIGDFFKKIFDKVKEIIDKIRNIKEKIADVGKNIITGLFEGIKNGLKKIGSKFEDTFSSIIELAKKVFGVASPSKEFAKIGSFLDQGLGLGVAKNTKYVSDSVQDMNDEVSDEILDKKTGIAAAINTLNDSLNSEIDSEPVIRPILDLTSIQNAKSQIAAILNANSSLSFDRATGLAQGISSQYESKKNTASDNSDAILAAINGISNEIRDMNDQTFENTFNITGANPREIAQEVADIIQRQVERRTAVWA